MDQPTARSGGTRLSCGRKAPRCRRRVLQTRGGKRHECDSANGRVRAWWRPYQIDLRRYGHGKEWE